MARSLSRGRAAVKDSGRGKMLARVHIAKKALGMDEETYRAMLIEGYRVDSAGKLNPDLLAQLMRSLEAQQSSPHPAAPAARHPSPPGGEGKGERTFPGRPRNMGPSRPRAAKREAAAGDTRAAQLQKIEALLTEAGRPWAYADGIARKICKADKIAWVKTHDLYKIIAALVKDAQRHGRPLK